MYLLEHALRGPNFPRSRSAANILFSDAARIANANGAPFLAIESSIHIQKRTR